MAIARTEGGVGLEVGLQPGTALGEEAIEVEVPEEDGLIPTGRGELLPVGTEGEAVDGGGVGVTLEGFEFVAFLAPQFNLAVAAA